MQEEFNAAALAGPALIMIEEEHKIEEEKDHGERGVYEESDSDSDRECLVQ